MNVKAYQLTLRIDLENSAFDDGDRPRETARILRRLAARLEESEGTALNDRTKLEGWMFDSNGNSVGEYKAAVRTFRNV